MGAVMSHAMGWSAERPAVAGVLAFSGFVPTVAGWRPTFEDRTGDPRLRRPRHPGPGDRDRLRPRRPRPLVAGGIDVTYRESDVVHTIDPADVPVAAEWLAGAGFLGLRRDLLRDEALASWRPEERDAAVSVHGPGRLWPWPRRPGVRGVRGSVAGGHGETPRIRHRSRTSSQRCRERHSSAHLPHGFARAESALTS